MSKYVENNVKINNVQNKMQIKVLVNWDILGNHSYAEYNLKLYYVRREH